MGSLRIGETRIRRRLDMKRSADWSFLSSCSLRRDAGSSILSGSGLVANGEDSDSKSMMARVDARRLI